MCLTWGINHFVPVKQQPISVITFFLHSKKAFQEIKNKYFNHKTEIDNSASVIIFP